MKRVLLVVILILAMAPPSYAVVKEVTIDMTQFPRIRGQWAVRNIIQINNNDVPIPVEFFPNKIRADVPILMDLGSLITVANIQATLDAEAAERAAARAARQAQWTSDKNALFTKHGFNDADMEMIYRIMQRIRER